MSHSTELPLHWSLLNPQIVALVRSDSLGRELEEEERHMQLADNATCIVCDGTGSLVSNVTRKRRGTLDEQLQRHLEQIAEGKIRWYCRSDGSEEELLLAAQSKALEAAFLLHGASDSEGAKARVVMKVCPSSSTR